MSLTVTYKGTDIIDETADCVKVMKTQGKYLEDDITIDYTGGTAPTLISKSITANGTYNASSDNADGYSSVTVNVPGITAGFTSEKYKNWLEINGYTIIEFTLVSQATADFNINHPLGRAANSIIAFRTDLDGTVNTTKRVDFSISLNGTTADTQWNRLIHYAQPYLFAGIGVKNESQDWNGVRANTSEYITFRVTGATNEFIWESGNYYLAVI